MKIVAIIPARGGSKGIPKKNILQLGGIPLIGYTIDHAIRTSGIDRVVVSTDDPEIAGIAEGFGAEVVIRPVDISDDIATSESALVHVLDYYKEKENYSPDYIVFLQATSPYRMEDDIQNAIDQILREDADSLFSASHINGFVWRKHIDGSITSLSYDFSSRPRRQDIGDDLLENGSIYILKPWVLNDTNNRLGGKITSYLMKPLTSFQIDEPEDLEIFEILHHELLKNRYHYFPQIALLVLDFDGVLSDNRVWVDENGKEAILANRSDGWGLARLAESGVDIIILSTEKNPVVAARAAKLRIPCIHGLDDKLIVLKNYAQKHSINSEHIGYIGNDLNDLECMKWVGTAIAVADADYRVKQIATYITEKAGGHGAVREVCDLILNQRDKI